jgi:hypothetical protein
VFHKLGTDLPDVAADMMQFLGGLKCGHVNKMMVKRTKTLSSTDGSSKTQITVWCHSLHADCAEEWFISGIYNRHPSGSHQHKELLKN